MPDLTPKLGLKKPLGNETVSRAAYNENLDLIDQNAASQDQVDEPFYLKSAVYDSGNNRIDLTFGPGRAVVLGTLVAKTADSTYSISAPAPGTTYYVYLKSDGTCTHNTTGASITGAVQIWRVTTGTTVDVISVEDARGRLPGAAARVVQDSLDSHKGATPADHPDGSITDAKLGNRTPDQAQAPSSPGSGMLTQILSWLANRIKAITGASNWWDTPATTLAAAKVHADAAAPHSGHETPSGAQAKVDAHAGATSVHGATSAPTAGRIIARDASGRAQVADPSVAEDVATKGYVDGSMIKHYKATVTTNSSGDAVITLPVTPTDVVSVFTPNQHRVAHYLRVVGNQVTVRIAKLEYQEVTSVRYDKTTSVGTPTNVPSGVSVATSVRETDGPSATTDQLREAFYDGGASGAEAASPTHTHEFPYLYSHQHSLQYTATNATVYKGASQLPAAVSEANVVVVVLYV